MPYPVGTDRVADGDNAIQALAEKVDAQLSRNMGAPVAGAYTTIAPASGWAGNGGYLLLRSGWVEIRLDVTRASWAANTPILAAIASNLWPKYTVYVAMFGRGSGAPATVTMNTAGVLTAGASNGSETQGLVGNISWPLDPSRTPLAEDVTEDVTP